MKLFLMILASLIISAQAQKKPVEIPSVFSDNMVLQQNSTAKFWGKAEAGTKVNVKASWGETASAVTKPGGDWLVKIKTPKAGGPFTVTLAVGDTTITYKNVLSGEVWVCSGQSNMEMPLKGWPPLNIIFNSDSEISNANYDQIRMITVKKDFSVVKRSNFAGTWEVCSPATAGNFSASAYFFGKKLHEELKVPVGLIFTSWGGTVIEAWTSEESMKEAGLFKDQLGKLEERQANYIAYKKWLTSHQMIADVGLKTDDVKWEGLDFNDKEFMNVNYTDKSWRELNVPGEWEKQGFEEFDGIAWLRKKIKIPAAWINKDLIIELGPVDDMDRTYVNGKLVGAKEFQGAWDDNRVYNIPAAINNSEEMIIAVRVLDTGGGGGFTGPKDKLKLVNTASGESLPLSGAWKCFFAAEYFDNEFYKVDESKNVARPDKGALVTANTPTTLYNAMINPLINFTIKGAIWYQGEANVNDPALYAKQLPLMIKDWRRAWGIKDFPFYFVQIAPFDYGENSYSQKLREAQLKSLSVPHTGMAVIMDTGNPANIHPGNKKDVGDRLAFWALAKDYGKNIPFSGPVYKSFKVEGSKIILTFDYADGLIIKNINGKSNFTIAGADKIFKPAEAKVEGNKIILTADGVSKPAAVRYAWSNTDDGTLFNGAGLPASSFRTDKWD